MNIRSWFCKHVWKEQERYYYTRVYDWDGRRVTNCILIIEKCLKCGKVRKIDLP